MNRINKSSKYNVIQCLGCEVFRLVKHENAQKCENSFQFTHFDNQLILFASIKQTN